MGQQLKIRAKRLRRKRWIDRKKAAAVKSAKKPAPAPAPAAAPVAAAVKA